MIDLRKINIVKMTYGGQRIRDIHIEGLGKFLTLWKMDNNWGVAPLNSGVKPQDSDGKINWDSINAAVWLAAERAPAKHASWPEMRRTGIKPDEVFTRGHSALDPADKQFSFSPIKFEHWNWGFWKILDLSVDSGAEDLDEFDI